MMRRLIPALVASVLLLAPLGARAADLVLWWDKGYYPQEDGRLLKRTRERPRCDRDRTF
jgi:hypothetical protein